MLQNSQWCKTGWADVKITYRTKNIVRTDQVAKRLILWQRQGTPCSNETHAPPPKI